MDSCNEKRMQVKLIQYPFNAQELCAEAATICTRANDKKKALASSIKSGHLSVLEHASFTFRVEGVSRVLLAQLTRHRLASYSVESQRYCGVEPEWVVPPGITGHKQTEVNRAMAEAYGLYNRLVSDGVPEEDARYIIPQGIACSLILTMNARELLHFFELRCCNRAQWEIRALADEMLSLCRIAAPEIFGNAGCACMQGKPCPEARPCGQPRKENGNGRESK